jgi:long-chain acyl-CoA synthetase
MKMLAELSRHGRFWQKRTAVIDAASGLRVSYGDLAQSIHGFRLFLDAQGVQPGARVTILSQSSFQMCTAILACLGNGVVANPLNPGLPEDLKSEFITHGEPSLVLTDDVDLVPFRLRDRVPVLSIEESLLPRAGSELQKVERPVSGGGLLIYTSGTTGTAKGVLLSVANIEANVATAAEAFGYKPGWTSGCLLPLYHTFSLISDVLPILLTGGTVVVLPAFEMHYAKLVVDSFKDYEVNSYSAAPIIFEAFTALDCLTEMYLQFAISGAAPLDEGVKADYETRFGHPIVPCYGLSESTCFATISPLGASRANSAGKAANIEICVRDEQGAVLAPGQTGEIALRGRSVISSGYYRDEERYASAFTPDGWLLTGDVGRIDKDGYVYVTGRKKNMVIRGGEKVYLEDLDRSLVQYPGIAQSASIVISARETWDRAISFISPRESVVLTREAVADYVQKNLGRNHIPDEIVFTDRIPRTPVGKPDYVELKSFYQSLKSS